MVDRVPCLPPFVVLEQREVHNEGEFQIVGVGKLQSPAQLMPEFAQYEVRHLLRGPGDYEYHVADPGIGAAPLSP